MSWNRSHHICWDRTVSLNHVCVCACFFKLVVTEEELAVALVEGEKVATPPDSLKNQLPSNGLADADTENDPQYYTMKETK